MDYTMISCHNICDENPMSVHTSVRIAFEYFQDLYLMWDCLRWYQLYLLGTSHPLILYHVILMPLWFLLSGVGFSGMWSYLPWILNIETLPLLNIFKCIWNKIALHFYNIFYINLYVLPWVWNDILQLLLLLVYW